jgi:putative endopeptidase
MGLTQADTFVVEQPTAITAIAQLIAKEPIEDWKAWLTFHALRGSAGALGKAFETALLDFSHVTSGTSAIRSRADRGVDFVQENFNDALGQIYVERHFPPGHKLAVEEMLANIRKTFGARIAQLSWMDDETRKAALRKLELVEASVGFPSAGRDFSAVEIDRAKLYENVQALRLNNWRRAVSRLSGSFRRDEWPASSPQTVNAIYGRRYNQIIIPAGILQPPFFDPEGDPAENYGAIGAIIGHEFGHAFDDQGRRYDGDGNLINWWTAETDKRFIEATRKLVSQYNRYCPYPFSCVSGAGTLGENIGDLGGAEVAYAAWKLSLGNTEAPVIDGLTGDQRFFIAFARAFRSKQREEVARNTLVSDAHAPQVYRVNGVVRNMDAWYSAFDVKPGDKLYLKPEDRVRIW